MFKKINGNAFLKNVSMVVGGTAAAQGINVMISPVITRIYSADEYGALTIYTAILALFSIIASMKYESGILIAEGEKKAVNILALSIITLILFVLLISAILFFFGDKLIEIFNLEAISELFFLIPIGIFFAGLYNIFSHWAFRKKDFKTYSKTKLNQSVYSNAIKIGLGLLNKGAMGLLIGHIIGASAGIMTFLYDFKKQELKLVKKISLKEMKWATKRYFNFFRFSAPAQLINAAGIQLPVLFLGSLYGAQTVGYYGLASSIVSLPVTLIGNSIGDVFYSEAASNGRSNPENLQKIANGIFKKMLIVSLVLIIIIYYFGPLLFLMFFGNNWSQSGEYARIIIFLVASRLIFMPISRVYDVFEKQKLSLGLDILRISIVLLIFIVAEILNFDSYLTLSLYTFAMSTIYFITYIIAQKIIRMQIELIG